MLLCEEPRTSEIPYGGVDLNSLPDRELERLHSGLLRLAVLPDEELRDAVARRARGRRARLELVVSRDNKVPPRSSAVRRVRITRGSSRLALCSRNVCRSATSMRIAPSMHSTLAIELVVSLLSSR